MDSFSLRQKFLRYFEKRGHIIVPSSPLLPYNDPTLLFTNAGMNQFKDIFLGNTQRTYNKAATIQKCIRAGGKHNDLENVGHTKRHLTFFEMLGNFSFGDYFKKDAIDFAWELSTEVLGFEAEKIWPSIYKEDEEAFELWRRHVPEARIIRFGKEENFWSMGETGPCGPCSELLYDRGPRYGSGKSPLEDPTGERYPEFWNLVFMQYNKKEDGTLEPLPKPCIDTGAGFERVVTFLNQVDNIFESDLLRELIAQIENVAQQPYISDNKDTAPAFRVIADHLRSLSFAIADGIQPSNLDRGYVLRKILRRAVRYGKQIGFQAPFLGKILPRLVELMGPDYPELVTNRSRIEEILHLEEESFFKTLQKGGNMLQKVISVAKEEQRMIQGEEAFKLKDTYGFPLEEISLIAKDHHLKIDLEAFQTFETQAKEMSKKAHKTTQQIAGNNLFSQYLETHAPCVFVGYQELCHNSKIEALYSLKSAEFVSYLSEGDEGIIILNETPFYAEMGGQVGDQGDLIAQHGSFKVTDCQKPFPGVIAHHGILEKGHLKLNDAVQSRVDSKRRQLISNHHTATHLLHFALQQILGPHIKQGGSVVDPSRLRFDFSHHKPLSQDEIEKIENLVNQKICENISVKDYELPYEVVQKDTSIKQFFGDKYGDIVRVVEIKESKELCGGTHALQTGSIGLFKIEKESSISSGIRRIEAISGHNAEEFVKNLQKTLDEVAQKLKAQPGKILEKLDKLLEEKQQLEVFKKQTLDKERHLKAKEYLKTKQSLGNLELVMVEDNTLDTKEMTLIAQEMTSFSQNLVAVLACSTTPSQCLVAIAVSSGALHFEIKADALVRHIAPVIEGQGGGKPQLAQIGGKKSSQIPQAFEAIKNLIRDRAC